MKTRQGQKSITYEGKRYKIQCGCTISKTVDYAEESEKYKVYLNLNLAPKKCPDCKYYPWIRLKRRDNP